MREPFELFPRTEKQAKFVVISIGLLFAALILAGALYGLGSLKVLLE